MAQPEPTAHGRPEQQPTDDLQLLADDARTELGRLAHPVEEAKRLEHVADEGSSGATPFLVLLAVIVLVGVVAAIVITIALLVWGGS